MAPDVTENAGRYKSEIPVNGFTSCVRLATFSSDGRAGSRFCDFRVCIREVICRIPSKMKQGPGIHQHWECTPEKQHGEKPGAYSLSWSPSGCGPGACSFSPNALSSDYHCQPRVFLPLVVCKSAEIGFQKLGFFKGCLLSTAGFPCMEIHVRYKSTRNVGHPF